MHHENISRRGHRPTGFSLIEMLMAVAIIAMIAALVIPSMSSNERLRLDAAATILISDIELVQVMNISAPKNPVVMCFDEAANAYWIALESSPDDPIVRAASNEPYRVVLGEGRALSAAGVTLRVQGMDDDMLRFSPHGGLADLGASPIIQLQWGDDDATAALHVGIAPTTGTITVEAVVVD